MAGLELLDESIDPEKVRRKIAAYAPGGIRSVQELMLVHSSKVNSHRRHIAIYAEHGSEFLDAWMQGQVDSYREYARHCLAAQDLVDGLQRTLDYLAHIKMESAEWDAFYYSLKEMTERDARRIAELEGQLARAGVPQVPQSPQSTELPVVLGKNSPEEDETPEAPMEIAAKESDLPKGQNHPIFAALEPYRDNLLYEDAYGVLAWTLERMGGKPFTRYRLGKVLGDKKDKAHAAEVFRLLCKSRAFISAGKFGKWRRWRLSQ
jgi:hypothetical protein